jgi:SAM-dependent methyltransferase
MTTNEKILNCTLCQTKSELFFTDENKVEYYHCTLCDLVFMSPDNYLNKEQEKKRYDLHSNNPEDLAYKKFLNRLCSPLCEVLPPNSFGLDFGCGPGPTLHLMFEQKGHKMHIYDPFYFPKNNLLQRQYDFITASEVVEHFYNPRIEFETLWKMLKPGGILGIMTKFLTEDISFENWHYKRESAHVCFYSKETFVFLAKNFKAELTLMNNQVALLKKQLQ